MKLLILGKTSYVGTSIRKYFEINHSHVKIDSISSRHDSWVDYSFAGYDAVVNTSGLCHADSRQGTPELYREVNTILPVRIAKKTKEEGVPLFVQISSAIVYGNMSRIGKKKTINQDTVPCPVNVYGESKLNADNELQKLGEESFRIAILRCPLIYGENARDNFSRLVKYAKKMPLFPNIQNEQSMIYVDNLAELVYLIIANKKSGIFLPQDEDYICTSRIVKDIADCSGNKLVLTSLFNPAIRLLSKKIYFINKVFGNIVYSKEVSSYFEGRYRVVSYSEAIRRISSR